MLSFLNKYGKNHVFSQFGEEGLLIECLRRMKIESGQAVEIGGNDGCYCSNTALLLLQHGWSGLFVEASYSLYLKCKQNWANNPKVRSQCSRVTPENIHAFVKEDCDLLSLDTDGMDYQLFKALKVKPKIVIVEIDSSYPPDVYAFNPDGAGTYRNTLMLGIEKGYFLLCHTANMVFVDQKYRDLFPEIRGDGLSNAELYFNRSHLKESAA